MRRIIITHFKNAENIIAKEKNQFKYFYISQNYVCFSELKNNIGVNIDIRNLSGLFDEVFQKIKIPLIDLMSSINKKNNSYDWWGSDLASRSTISSSLVQNVTLLFCVKNVLSNFSHDICFIVDSPVLSDCIKKLSIQAGCDVKNHLKNFSSLVIIKYKLVYIYRVLSFLFNALLNRKAVIKTTKPLSAKKTSTNKRIIIRSWFTEDSLVDFANYRDRNFGNLPDWLRGKNYEIWTLPTLFNLSSSLEKIYSFMNVHNNTFILPDHYLKFIDYFFVIYDNFKTNKIPIGKVEIKGIELTPLFDDVLIKNKYSRNMLFLNLCVPMLKRLKEKNFEIDGFYYSFENNTPEKQFILACRKYFKDSKIIAFQHTTFFPNQIAYHLGPSEKEYCPLPDKIVCSGPIYVDLHKKANFPSDILVPGPNLRFGQVHEFKIINHLHKIKSKKTLLLPVCLTHELAFELFIKVKEAILDYEYKIYIRIHPLLSKDKIFSIIDKIQFKDIEISDGGNIQDWLNHTYTMILTGASMATLEAVVMGIPVIRVIPDNTFSLDPLVWNDYPIKPAGKSREITQRLKLIDDIFIKDKNTFKNIAIKVSQQYFTKPDNTNLNVFL